MAKCPHCNGGGKVQCKDELVYCYDCHGTGKVADNYTNPEDALQAYCANCRESFSGGPQGTKGAKCPKCGRSSD